MIFISSISSRPLVLSSTLSDFCPTQYTSQSAVYSVVGVVNEGNNISWCWSGILHLYICVYSQVNTVHLWYDLWTPNNGEINQTQLLYSMLLKKRKVIILLYPEPSGIWLRTSNKLTNYNLTVKIEAYLMLVFFTRKQSTFD